MIAVEDEETDYEDTSSDSSTSLSHDEGM